MKPEIIIQQGLKSANILLKNAQQRAAELDHLKDLMDVENEKVNEVLRKIRTQFGF